MYHPEALLPVADDTLVILSSEGYYKRMEKKCTKIFIAVQAVLYASFMLRDISGAGDSRWIKYASIALCLAFSAFLSERGGEKLVTAALGFTLAADTFLLLLDSSYAVGVALFCAVQALYFARIYRANGGHSAALARLALFAAGLVLLAILKLLSPLNLLVCFYFTSFLCNAVQSMSIKKPLFSVGLILFLCCDICVGIHNMPGMFPTQMQSFADIGMWMFYLPSQVLITLSGSKKL